MDKPIVWNPDKNSTLKAERGVSFEEVSDLLENDDYLDIQPHYNNHKYPNQNIFYVLIRGYVYMVPYVENEDYIFLKTIIPSRKAYKRYITSKRRKS
jgi:uncharacterized DUF497 family protein